MLTVNFTLYFFLKSISNVCRSFYQCVLSFFYTIYYYIILVPFYRSFTSNKCCFNIYLSTIIRNICKQILSLTILCLLEKANIIFIMIRRDKTTVIHSTTYLQNAFSFSEIFSNLFSIF